MQATRSTRHLHAPLRVKVPTKPQPPQEADDDHDDPLALSPKRSAATTDECGGITLDGINRRGLFLLTMVFVVFGAFVLFILTDMTHHHPSVLLPQEWSAYVHLMTIRIFLIAIPLTSLAAWWPTALTIVHTPTSAHTTKPKCHGKQNFWIYQSIVWLLYAAMMTALIVCWSNPQENAPIAAFCTFGYQSNLAVAAFIAEVLVISSVLALEERRNRNGKALKERFVVLLNNYINMLLVVGALVLAVGSEYTKRYSQNLSSDRGTYSLNAGVGSLLLFVTALLNTYGLGGLLSTKHGWKFYQPFTGGAKFMAFQAVSWTCFGVGVVIQALYLLSIVIVELELFVGAMLVAGTLFVVSEILMMVSLLVFKADEDEDEVVKDQVVRDVPPTHSLYQRLHAFADECLGALLVGMLANIQWIPSMLFFGVYAALTKLSMAEIMVYGVVSTFVQTIVVVSRGLATHWYSKDSKHGQRTHISPYRLQYIAPQVLTGSLPAIATYWHYVAQHDAFYGVLVLSIYFYAYISSYHGDPQLTGARTKKHWVTGRSRLFETVVQYFDAKIIRVEPLSPTQPYIMSLHPHGIMAISAMWLQFCDQWRQLFPGVHAHLLVASVLHQIPLARDLLQFYGSREVTRQAFARTLMENESVMLVPGGQAEMLYQQSQTQELRVYTGHKGFIRLAIEHGVPLVPILSFQEAELMDNVQMPMIQKWFVKKLAVPFPFLPYGRGLLPIPRKVPTTIVVGAPLPVEKKANPTLADVDAVHRRYFDGIRTLFETYKDQAGCPNHKLVLI